MKTKTKTKKPKGDPEVSTDLIGRLWNVACKRGFGLSTHERGLMLMLEVAELVEAARGKRGSVDDEAGDVLITLLLFTEAQGVAWEDVVMAVERKVAKLEKLKG